MDATTLFQDLSDAVDVELAETFGIYDDGSVWRESPVSLAEFVVTKEHLGLGPLYPLQQQSMDRLLGDDPERIYTEPGAEDSTREFQIAVLLWGKGSGKDYLCSIVVCYLVYVLLCLRDPQRYFEFGRGEPIDVVNVAYNADQAKKVFFEKLKQRMFGWRWLRENYNVYESGRLYGDTYLPGKPDVAINDGWVQFPRHIRCFSRHSQNESYEGYNIIAWVMDEASAFLSKAERENADKIYQTLRTSAASRFMRRWVGFIISYPRHGDDFTMTKHAEAERDPTLGIMADGPRKTWEVNTRLGRGDFYEVRPGHEVPIELANDYLLDYEAAVARYECDPPSARDAFFRFPDRLDDSLAVGRSPLVEWEPVVTRRTVSGPDGRAITRRFSGVKLTKLGKVPRGTRIFAHGDPGLKHDSFSLTLGHGVPATIMVHVPASEVMVERQLALWLAEDPERTPETLIEWEQDVVRTVIDAVIVWNPDFKHDQQVDLLNVDEVILELRKHYKIGFAAKEPTFTFDQWNSAEMIQKFQSKHMNVEDESWSGPFQLGMFRNARSCFYNDLVTLPDTPSVTSTDPLAPGALYELKRLELIEDRKVDHPEGGSKDIADGIARVIQHVTGAARSGFAFGTAFGHRSLNEVTGPYIPQDRPPSDPNSTPKMGTPAAQEREKERRAERPLGELEPASGSVNGSRRLAFASVRRK